MRADVERHVSPCGRRVVMIDRCTGDVWLARRLLPGEAEDAVAMIPRWDAKKSGRPPRAHLTLLEPEAHA